MVAVRRSRGGREELTERTTELLHFGFTMFGGGGERIERENLQEVYEANADAIEAYLAPGKGVVPALMGLVALGCAGSAAADCSRVHGCGSRFAGAPAWAREKGISFGVASVFEPSDDLRIESQFAYLLRHELLTPEEVEAVARGIQQPPDYDPLVSSSIKN